MNKRIFMKFSTKVAHEAKNNMEHFRDVAVNPLNTGSIVLFSGFVIFGNIMEKADKRIFMKFVNKCRRQHKK